jgi:vanillate/4-hydroxybenzoate decarboxylase subunit D
MTHTFRRPVERHLTVERRPVEGSCGECGAEALCEYRVLSDGGWFDVRKCQRCLASLTREPAPPYGSYVPLGLEIARSVE